MMSNKERGHTLKTSIKGEKRYLECYSRTKLYIPFHLQAIQLHNARNRLEATLEVTDLHQRKQTPMEYRESSNISIENTLGK